MFDSTKELLERIRLGEDGRFEFKEVRLAGEKVVSPARYVLADELAAFANSRGGVVVLGVDDETRDILGIPLDRLDRVEDLVREVCHDAIKPPLAPFIERRWLPTLQGQEAAVLKIDVERSLFVHQSPGGYLHRIGSSKREMAPEYLARLFQQRSQARLIRFEEQVVPRSRIEDLSVDLWSRFRTPRSDGERESLLHKLALIREDQDGTMRPTVAGVLLASEDPRQWLSNAFIQAVAYRGTEPRPTNSEDPYQLDAADISGPLDQQIIDACHFVAKNMHVTAHKGIGRTDLPQYHLGAVFEAVVNAVAHRDYSIFGSKIRLRLFSDRLELYSPGALANTMELDTMPLRQSARNEAIVSLLSKIAVPKQLDALQTGRTTMMDRRGEGVSLLLAESEELSGRRPVYRLIDESELLLTIFAAPAVSSEGGSRIGS